MPYLWHRSQKGLGFFVLSVALLEVLRSGNGVLKEKASA